MSGVGSGAASIPIRAASRSGAGSVRGPSSSSMVFVSKIHQSTTSASMLSYCRTISPHVRQVSKFKRPDGRDFASFVILVADGLIEPLLSSEVWERGCVFKRFIGVLNQDRIEETEVCSESS